MADGLKRVLDYSDYLATPDDGKRYEIIGGDLYVTPSPRTVHQRVSRYLEIALYDYFHGRSSGEVFHAPFDLILGQHDILVPDILVAADAGQVTERGMEAPPLLVVEILSRSTATRDRGVKARCYAAFGVRHYWIVDADGQTIECHRLRQAGAYERLFDATGDTVLVHPDFEGLEVDLSRLWMESGRR